MSATFWKPLRWKHERTTKTDTSDRYGFEVVERAPDAFEVSQRGVILGTFPTLYRALKISDGRAFDEWRGSDEPGREERSARPSLPAGARTTFPRPPLPGDGWDPATRTIAHAPIKR